MVDPLREVFSHVMHGGSLREVLSVMHVGPLREVIRIMHGEPFEGSFLYA